MRRVQSQRSEPHRIDVAIPVGFTGRRTHEYILSCRWGNHAFSHDSAPSDDQRELHGPATPRSTTAQPDANEARAPPAATSGHRRRPSRTPTMSSRTASICAFATCTCRQDSSSCSSITPPTARATPASASTSSAERGNLELPARLRVRAHQHRRGRLDQQGRRRRRRRRGRLHLSPEDPPDGTNFGWFTIEFTFINHKPINKYVSFRYGGGAGLGILTGGLYHYDVHAAAARRTRCPSRAASRATFGGHRHRRRTTARRLRGQPVKYDLPPVFPVINAIVGFQFHPFDKVVINLEGGIRTLPFFGMSFGYFIN